MDKKKIDKIYKKIDAISKKGSIGRIEYYQYVDELVTNNQYSIFQDTLERKYGINTMNMPSVDEVKKMTFNQIRFQTTSKFQEDLKKIFDKSSLVQIGQNVTHVGNYLGKIIQTDLPTDIELSVFNSLNVNIIIGGTASLLDKYQSSINFLLS